MNEKKEKRYKIIIIILFICVCISTSISIYYGRSASADYANKLRSTIERLESRITELSDINDQQGKQLTNVLNELREANNLVGELGNYNRRAVELVRRSNERLIEFERSMGTTGANIEGLITRQRIIDNFVRELWEDNIRLRETLSFSDPRG